MARGLERGHIDAARIKTAGDKKILEIKNPDPMQLEFMYRLGVGEEATIYLAIQEKTDVLLVDN